MGDGTATALRGWRDGTASSITGAVLYCTAGELDSKQRRGGENWAGLTSLIETCELNGVNPQTYFADLLTRLGRRLASTN